MRWMGGSFRGETCCPAGKRRPRQHLHVPEARNEKDMWTAEEWKPTSVIHVLNLFCDLLLKDWKHLLQYASVAIRLQALISTPTWSELNPHAAACGEPTDQLNHIVYCATRELQSLNIFAGFPPETLQGPPKEKCVFKSEQHETRKRAKQCKAMQSNAKQCKAMQSNAKQCKAMQSNAKQCKAMQSNAKQCKAMQSNAKQCKAMQSNAKQCKAMQSNAKQCKAMQSNAKQCKAMQSNAKQCKAMQSTAERRKTGKNKKGKSITYYRFLLLCIALLCSTLFLVSCSSNLNTRNQPNILSHDRRQC